MYDKDFMRHNICPNSVIPKTLKLNINIINITTIMHIFPLITPVKGKNKYNTAEKTMLKKPSSISFKPNPNKYSCLIFLISLLDSISIIYLHPLSYVPNIFETAWSEPFIAPARSKNKNICSKR